LVVSESDRLRTHMTFSGLHWIPKLLSMRRLINPFLLSVAFCALLFAGTTTSAQLGQWSDRDMSPGAFEHFVNGHLFELSGDLQRAVAEYQKAKSLQPDAPEIRITLAEAYLRMKEWEPAKTELWLVEPKDTRIYTLLGDCYRASDQVDTALWAYGQAVELDSTNLDALWRLAEGWQIKRDPDKMLFYMRKLASLQSLSVPIHLQLAAQLFWAKEYDQAIAEYRRVLEISPGEGKAMFGLGQTYEAQGDLDQAIHWYEILLESEPGNHPLREKLISLYYRTDRIDQAVKEAEKSPSSGTAGHSSRKRLAILYLMQGDLERAESLFVECIKEDPGDAESHFHLGKIALSQENLEKAKVEFKAAVSWEDTVPDGWINLAYVYLQQDSTQQAIRTYEKGIEKSYGKAELLFRLGSLYVEERQYDTALAVLRNASDRRPHDPNILFALGSTYEQSGDFDRAVATFERLLRVDPENATALNYLGYMLADKGIRLDESLDMIRRALEQEPENGAYLDSYGWVLYRLGRLPEAETQLKRALESMDTDPIVHEHLGDVYHAMGDGAKARQEWQEALKLDPENRSLKKKLGTSE
jgi:tetratricopeptide (TPR) repeat protein